jgi:hypothetical protein
VPSPLLRPDLAAPRARPAVRPDSAPRAVYQHGSTTRHRGLTRSVTRWQQRRSCSPSARRQCQVVGLLDLVLDAARLPVGAIDDVALSSLLSGQLGSGLPIDLLRGQLDALLGECLGLFTAQHDLHVGLGTPGRLRCDLMRVDPRCAECCARSTSDDRRDRVSQLISPGSWLPAARGRWPGRRTRS